MSVVGQVTINLTFKHGGACEFGQLVLRTASTASRPQFGLNIFGILVFTILQKIFEKNFFSKLSSLLEAATDRSISSTTTELRLLKWNPSSRTDYGSSGSYDWFLRFPWSTASTNCTTTAFGRTTIV